MKKIPFFIAPCVIFILNCSNEFPRIEYTPDGDVETNLCTRVTYDRETEYCDPRTGITGENKCYGRTDYNPASELCDVRDGKLYKYKVIFTQIWMTENLNYNTNDYGSRCYSNDESNCLLYGKLYNWEASTKVCPIGWHLPSDNEWLELISNVTTGNSSPPVTILKATTGWKNDNGTDDHGFSALPGGVTNQSIGYVGVWWTSDDVTTATGYGRYIGDIEIQRSVMRVSYNKEVLISVRCVKDK